MKPIIDSLLTKLLIESKGPETGPFYILRDDVHPAYDDTIVDGTELGTHMDYWEYLVSKLFSELTISNPELYKDLLLAHTGAPRGRVVVTEEDSHTKPTAWTIYLPSDYINDTKIIELVRRWYNLPAGKIKIDTDMHYEESIGFDEETVEEALLQTKATASCLITPRHILMAYSLKKSLELTI